MKPIRLLKMPFGEHFGKRWSEVPDSYLDWIIRKLADDPKKADAVHTARIEIARRRAEAPADVQTDDPDDYLNHTFSGKPSVVGTLFSLADADYKAPGRNIAVYGHHLRSSGEKMFTSLMRYKNPDFYEDNKTVMLDSLYRHSEYTIFAVVNMEVGDWEPSRTTFSGDAAFMAFVNRAKSESLYDTGVEVGADDHILTLITCDRSYAGKEGRLVILAVER